MTESSKVLLQEYNLQFDKYGSIIKDNPWLYDVAENPRTGDLESDILKVEMTLIAGILRGVDKFKTDMGSDIHSKSVRNFLKKTSDIIQIHLNRIQDYQNEFQIGVGDEAVSLAEIKFDSELFTQAVKIKTALTKLNLDGEQTKKGSLDLFYGDEKATIPMREYLCKTIPDVKVLTDSLGIDFTDSFMNYKTSKMMYIHMKPEDIPYYDPNKHFFEQTPEAIRFWEEEFRKIKYGVDLGGYHMSGWLYFDMNHFMVDYIHPETEIKGAQPALLRDNELYFEDMYEEAKRQGNVGALFYGSRRFSKSKNMSSKLYYNLLTIPNCKGTVQAFSERPDMKAIMDYFSIHTANVHPALKVPLISLSVSEGAVLGLKGKKAQNRYEMSKLYLVNMDGGTTKEGTQKTAGSTPDIFLLDEIGKGACIKPWNAAKPSFASGTGKWRCVPMLAGTAGESELSKEAEEMLKSPSEYSILKMDWEILNKYCPEEFRTWDATTTFATFIPAQMSLEGAKKVKSNLGVVLGLEDNPYLKNIDVWVTDWESQKQYFEGEREKLSNNLANLASFMNSYPLKPEDCYLTTEINKFPGIECKMRKDYIVQQGIVGDKVRLVKDSMGVIKVVQTPNDPVIEHYPFKGGVIDAPIMMLENPLLRQDTPPLGLYVLGLDDVKQNGTDGDSVMSACIFKRGYEGGEWANRIVAYYDSRPDKKVTFYKQLYMLMKIYNARVLYENADNGFIEYLEQYHPEDVHVHFSRGVGLASEENMHYNKNRKFGWVPTTQNIYLAEQKVVMYTKEENVVVGDTVVSGVDRINHPMLLEELYKYKKDNNADRLRSFSLALTLARYYDNTHQYMAFRKRSLRNGMNYQENRNKKHESKFGGLIWDDRLL